MSLGAGESPAASFVGPRVWAPPPFEVVDGEPVRLATSDLRLEVETGPLRLTFADAAGEWLLREPADAGMVLERGADGAGRVRARFTFSGEQHFYGLGQGGGRLDRLGQGRQLWNSHLGHGPGSDIAIPLLVSNRGYALFFDNPSDAFLSVGRSDNGVRIDYTVEAPALTWYFLIAADLRGLMGEVAELLGRAPLPPRWALGFLQSTRHFDDTAELQRLPRTPARSAFRATRSSISRPTARRRAGTAGSGTSSGSPSCGRSRRRCSTRCAVSTSSSSRTSTPCSTSSRRSSPRPRRAAIC